MLVIALLLALWPSGSLLAQRAGDSASRAAVTPMSGVEVSESQRAAMRASWALVAAEWEAVLARSRAAGGVSEEDAAVLKRLAREHNERLLEIFSAEQRRTLERNLEALRGASA